MSTQLKEKINISVDSIETLTDVDLADLCNITEQAIKAGGGFGWLRVPTRDILICLTTGKMDVLLFILEELNLLFFFG